MRSRTGGLLETALVGSDCLDLKDLELHGVLGRYNRRVWSASNAQTSGLSGRELPKPRGVRS